MAVADLANDPAAAAAEAQQGDRRSRAPLGAAASAKVGLGIVVAMALLGVLVPIVSPYGPNEFVAPPLEGASWSHPFGTDALGRDLFTRTFAAARVDLVVAAVAVTASLLLGSTVGMVVTFARRRWAETLLMRIVDVIIAFPFLVLVLTLVLVFGSTKSWGPLPAGLPALLVGVIVWDWTVYARLARAETRRVRDADYIVAARVIGYPSRRILRRHVMPQVMRPALAYAVADAVIVLITTAGLPFVGAGVQPPTAEWGSMMFEGRTVLQSAWWVVIVPGLALAITGIGLSLLADGMLARDARRAP
jgi:peptide/nickel transport system permease protein